jgi:cobalamin biosynthesis protein CbiG
MDMPGHKHGSQIKDEETYEALRREGESKEKAARIANAKAAGELHHESTHLEDRSKEELYDEAKKIGIECRSEMSKDELIDAIRHH